MRQSCCAVADGPLLLGMEFKAPLPCPSSLRGQAGRKWVRAPREGGPQGWQSFLCAWWGGSPLCGLPSTSMDKFRRPWERARLRPNSGLPGCAWGWQCRAACHQDCWYRWLMLGEDLGVMPRQGFFLL